MSRNAVTDAASSRSGTSQPGESCTQYVDRSEPDARLSLALPGNVESPDSPSFDSQLALWEEGALKPAPLSAAAVELMTSDVTLLSMPGAPE